MHMTYNGVQVGYDHKASNGWILAALLITVHLVIHMPTVVVMANLAASPCMVQKT